MALTVLTVYAQPAPLKLGAQHLAQLEERVLAAGRAGWQVSSRPQYCLSQARLAIASHSAMLFARVLRQVSHVRATMRESN